MYIHEKQLLKTTMHSTNSHTRLLPAVLKFLFGPDIILANSVGLLLKMEWG